jgi:hypothetical protein
VPSWILDERNELKRLKAGIEKNSCDYKLGPRPPHFPARRPN